MRFVMALTLILFTANSSDAMAAQFLRYNVDYSVHYTINPSKFYGSGKLSFDQSVYRLHGTQFNYGDFTCTYTAGFCDNRIMFYANANSYPGNIIQFILRGPDIRGGWGQELYFHAGTITKPGSWTFSDFKMDAVVTATLIEKKVNGPVPEPSTWALMILGFGGIGAAMRRRASAGRVTARVSYSS